jgi:hypothetical protein
MQMLYDLLGRLLFPRRQRWEQRKSAKAMMFTLAFSLTLGLVMAAVMRLMYNHGK